MDLLTSDDNLSKNHSGIKSLGGGDGGSQWPTVYNFLKFNYRDYSVIFSKSMRDIKIYYTVRLSSHSYIISYGSAVMMLDFFVEQIVPGCFPLLPTPMPANQNKTSQG